MKGRTKRGGVRSTRVTSNGVSAAGKNAVPRNRSIVASALPVCSKTRTERATMPSQSPISLTAKEIARRRNAGRRRGSRRRASGMGRCTSYFISAQVSIFLHNFRATSATTSFELGNQSGEDRGHGLPPLRLFKVFKVFHGFRGSAARGGAPHGASRQGAPFSW